METIDYSIIIPHKNSSKLLERLIISCLVVKDYNIQIIVIDDHSNSNELECLNTLQKKYFFELYINTGVGAGAARNTGLKHVKGKWTIFADSDDFFCESLPNLCSKYINNDSDIIYFNVTSLYSDSLERAYRDMHIKNIINKYIQFKEEGYLRCCYTAPWGKFINTNYLIKNNFSFEEIIAGNDMMFSVLTGIKANKICCDNTELYCNTVSAGSITTTLSKDRFNSRFHATLRVNNILRKEKFHKHQISILYFVAKSYQFGFKYFINVISHCIKNRSNPFIGLKKILHYKSVVKDRQNPQYTQKL